MAGLRFHATSILVLFLTLPSITAFGKPSSIDLDEAEPEPPAPQMGDVGHAMMAEHAALSYGLTDQQAGWLSQGAWDEDHCSVDLYPPSGPLCFPAIPSGHHSWDPDTNTYWDQPEWWGDFGSALTRARLHFFRAVQAYQDGHEKTAYLWLGRAMHLWGDMATPAHVHLDAHLPGDGDKYESWLSADGQANTSTWIEAYPPGQAWKLSFHDIPEWENLPEDLQTVLESASQVYGERGSGQELWLLGPQGEDPVIFRLLYLLAEAADNWDSNDVQGELYHGQLDDSAYLGAIRDTLFPLLASSSTALIDYFHQTVLPPAPPIQITPPDSGWIEGNFPTLSWHPVGVNPEYDLQVAHDPQFESLLLDTRLERSSYHSSEFFPGGIYYWRVRALTDSGQGEWSLVRSFNVMWSISLPVICQLC
jgi:hypothetical protein